MEINTNNFSEKAEQLFNQGKFKEVIALLTDDVLRKQKNAELYAWRSRVNYRLDYDVDVTMLFADKAIDADQIHFMGYFAKACACDSKKEYDKAIDNYTKTIELNPDFADAYYNRGLVWQSRKEYDKALKDCDRANVNYNKAIEINPRNAELFFGRGNTWYYKENYDKAIEDYTEAIKKNPVLENAYYSRGLAKKEKNFDPKGSKQDFEKYLELTINKNDIWAKYARYYIKDLDEKIKDPDLSFIKQLVNNVKDKLLIKEECVTHYTSLSILKKLILEESKFRISEGNFMNDPSEGQELFHFLEDKNIDGSFSESFSPKPFIGSFVAKDNHNDLNMWKILWKRRRSRSQGVCHYPEYTEIY